MIAEARSQSGSSDPEGSDLRTGCFDSVVDASVGIKLSIV